MPIRIRVAFLASLAATLAFGCTIAIPPAPSPSASPITAADLSGTWVFGSGNEPASGPVAECNPFQDWRLTQQGTALSGNVESCLGPCSAFTETVSGTNQNGQVQLTGEARTSFDASPTPVTYQLNFDARTQHLVGTRNGQPFWAAPLVTPASCGPGPA